jgi:putative mRNA 3-end processing factor
MDMVVTRPEGLYCVPGNFYIDPWRPVPRAVITHAHADHARRGHAHYLAEASGEAVLRARMGDISLDTLAYGERVEHNGVTISLHPAGHVLGSSQVRLEHRGEVWVVSGDYKLEVDPTCIPFEPVHCHTFITESTFGLPVYRWQSREELRDELNQWWRANADAGLVSVLFCYAFGKAQRLLAELDPSIGPILTHGAVETLNTAYRHSGVVLPETQQATVASNPANIRRALVVAPPSAQGSAWMKRFGEYRDAFASGWMRVRGMRRRRGVDRGFVVSDHADWPGLLSAISASQAQRVIVTHGQVHALVRWLNEQGLQAGSFHTEYGDEDEVSGSSDAGETSDPVASDAASFHASTSEVADATETILKADGRPSTESP